MINSAKLFCLLALYEEAMIDEIGGDEDWHYLEQNGYTFVDDHNCICLTFKGRKTVQYATKKAGEI